MCLISNAYCLRKALESIADHRITMLPSPQNMPSGLSFGANRRYGRTCLRRLTARSGLAGSPGSLVGYHVRLDAAATSSTRLLFCTTGILLRRLASDPRLSSITHIVVDEASFNPNSAESAFRLEPSFKICSLLPSFLLHYSSSIYRHSLSVVWGPIQ